MSAQTICAPTGIDLVTYGLKSTTPLDALDRAYDDIGNARKLICSCHDKESFDNSEVHHCFNVDNKKNWSLIESYVTDHLADSNNVSAWGNENTFLMENDTSL